MTNFGAGVGDQELEAKKRASSGQLLFKAARLWNERAVERIRALTGRPVKLSWTRLFPHLDFEGRRPTEIAKAAGISKQVAGRLLDELTAEGVVERIPDPLDGRAHLVRFTARGREGLVHGLTVLLEMEGELGAKVGAERMAALHEALVDVVAALSGEDGP